MVSDQPSGQSRGVRGLSSPVGCPRSPGLGAGWSTATGTQGRAAPGHCQASPSVKENSQLCSRQELVSAGTSSTMSPPPRSCFPARVVPRHGFFGCVPVEGLEGDRAAACVTDQPIPRGSCCRWEGGDRVALLAAAAHTHIHPVGFLLLQVYRQREAAPRALQTGSVHTSPDRFSEPNQCKLPLEEMGLCSPVSTGKDQAERSQHDPVVPPDAE